MFLEHNRNKVTIIILRCYCSIFITYEICVFPETNGDDEEKNLVKESLLSAGRRKKGKDPPCKWDNGVDWRLAVKECGDWVRAYPLLLKDQTKDDLGRTPTSSHHTRSDSSSTITSLPNAKNSASMNDRETRHIVLGVNKLSKLAKDIYFNNIGCSDDKKDNILLYKYTCTDVVWHPAPGFHDDSS